MAVKLRMKKFGRKNRPEFRVVAADARAPRDGSIIENLGFYHPLEQKAEKVLNLKVDRIKHWLSVGAQPSETLVSIFKKLGIQIPWVERAKEKLKKEVSERRAKKGKGPKAARAARPAGQKKEKPAAEAGAAEAAPGAKTGAETSSIDDKAKAAASKAAKREAKKAK